MSKYAVINPATGETVRSYVTATDTEVSDAIDGAFNAYRGWSRSTTVVERAALIAKVADLHRERRQQLAEIIVREMGKPIGDALGEVDFSADIYQYYADNGPALLADESIVLAEGSEGSAVIRKSAMGVLLGIMPWNFHTTKSRASPGQTSFSATRSCSSTRLSALSQRRRSTKFSRMPDCQRARTPTCTPRPIKSARLSPTLGCKASHSPAPSARVLRSPNRRAVTSRRSCSSWVVAIHSSC